MAANVSKTNNVVKKSERKNIKSTHKIVKRPPAKREQGQNVIYVTSNSNIKALEERFMKLVYDDVNEIIIYCLGAAIKRGILLALQISEKYCGFQISANTFTTELIDDLEPATDEVDYEIQHRANSALRIVLTRKL